jgi:hypothetical protein
MGRKGYCGKGQTIVRSHNLPVHLVDLLDKFAEKTGREISEVVSKGICHEINEDLSDVLAKNEELYPKVVLIAR